MTIPTNKVGILIVEIDSGGALRSAGDRVILGARSSKSEQEWIVRQKIGECSARITDSVHQHGGIVARQAAESMFGTFPCAKSAFRAACEIQRTHNSETHKAMESNNAAPLGLRLGLSFGKMIVDAGRLSGDTIYVAGQIAAKASAGQIVAAENLVNALGDDVRGRVNSLGSAKFDELQGEVEIFEIQWNDVKRAQTSAPPAPARGAETAQRPEAAESPAATETGDEASAPAAAQEAKPGKLQIQSRGKAVVMDSSHPTLTLRSGKPREPHVRIEYRDDRFYLVNLRANGTRIRIGDEESLVLDETTLDGEGTISLGLDFEEGSADVLKFKRLS